MSALIRPADLKGVPIIFARSPFAAMNGDRFEDLRPAGESLAEIVASVPDLPRSFGERGVVCINGDPVPRRLWRSVRPKPTSDVTPIAVTLHMPLGNGGAGGGASGGRKSTFALIASIALLAAGVAVSGGLLAPFLGAAFASGGIGATLLAAGVNLAGSLLIAALSPPPVLSGAQNGGGDQSKGSASADGNIIAIGGPLPRVCGTFRIFPPPVAQPLIEIVGDNEIVTQVYALAGPHALSDIRVDGADVNAAVDISSETREGWISDAPLTLATRQAYITLPQAQITRPLLSLSADPTFTDGGFTKLLDQSTPDIDLSPWVPTISRDSPDEIWLHLYWPQGLGYPGNANAQVFTPMRFRMRRRGDTAWINLPEIHFADHRQLLVRRAVKLIWGTAPTLPTPPSDYGAVYAYKATPQQTYATPPTVPQGWVANAHFSAGGGSDLMSSSGSGNVQNVALYNDRVEFYLDAAKFPKGVYEIQLRRGAQYSNNVAFAAGTSSFNATTYNYFVGLNGGLLDFFYYVDLGPSGIYRIPFMTLGTPDQVILARVQSIWNNLPVPKPGNALLCLRATNRSLSQVSVLASGYVRDWNATSAAWTDWKTTSNPAPHFRDVLMGSLTSRPVPAVNDTRLTDWNTRCTNYGYQFNAILDGRNMAEALSLLASAGYARPRKSESWSVIIDQDRSTQTAAQIFNPRNLANFRMEKAFADLPDGFIVTYRDANNDYLPAQTVVYRNGYGAGNARRLEAVDYIGPVTAAEATARARFDLAQVEARATFYYADADVEAVVTEAGDLVGVQHDILHHYAGAAYIKAVRTSGGNVTGLVLDSKIPATQPDDFFAVDDIFGLNNVFGCVRAIDFFELVDVFTTNDIFADNPGEFGIAVRCKDGTILLKGITAQSADADDITINTPFADPGTSILDAGCLVQSGTLGREYLRLILREARPGKDLTAALTFVDEAPELWAVAA